jgi:molybdate-binding protein/DNA-binding transcriptional regulator YhcF (GntR family)
MYKKPLYQEIISSIQQGIAQGNLKPGDSLPSVREMADRWDCAPGTIQRVYNELNQSGLIVTRPRVGAQVAERISGAAQTPLQRAQLINQAESFILEELSSGHSPADIEQAVQIALDRWRTQPPEGVEPANQLKFAGSHDPALSLVLSHLEHPFDISYTGSMAGLMALANRKADLAGCHLLDIQTLEYNTSYIRHLMPGRRVARLRLADRYLGIIIPLGNPMDITDIPDLVEKELRFINRQDGAGTRVWLDFHLREQELKAERIRGYENVAHTHTEVAQVIASNQADAGLGIYAAAHAYNLDFIRLSTESYDIVIPQESWDHPMIQSLITALQSANTKALIEEIGGYDTTGTGTVEWIDA